MKKTDWLTLDEAVLPKTEPRIESTGKITRETTRGKAAQKKPAGRSRAWTCDGEYIWYRPKLANPAIKSRLAKQLAAGELKHVSTQDDVQVYQVLPKSAFHRPALDLTAVNLSSVVRYAVVAACKGDWVAFVDGLSEISHRYKNAQYSDGKPGENGFTRLLYQEKLTHVFHLIRLRGGPSPQLIDREVSALRARRGEGRGTQIVLPTRH